ncbi:DEAD/DEAH box helicase [Actinospica robiniae]|uniref:DEAD/DEAH box helicase n=1 Tax=Actinospica robiniae TaxID=304901 RepID=UPI000404A4A1|nr:DEAD/DEAH box helicase [Actinospica robiniae]
MAARRPAGSTAPTRARKPAPTAATTLAPAAPAAVPAATTFTELGVPESVAEVLATQGITTPFPIQAATLPDSLAGRDVLGRGRTGSGKTLGFLLPVLIRLARDPRRRQPNHPRALVLAPTRELATQIHAAAEPLAKALGLRTAVIFGGVGARPQISALRSGVDLVIACPGRLLDHIEGGHAMLDAIEITVLDEADHMADLGFLPMVKRLLDATPAGGQRLLFSATLDQGVDQLVRRYLNKPVTHAVDSPHAEVPTMTHHLLHIEAEHRLAILVELTSAPGRTIVFTRTKHGARKLAKQLLANRIPAVDLHGNLNQGARTRNLTAFAAGQATTLVATDIAARGIHVDEVALVVHADPPVEHKAYLHRSGRTARAGSSGTVVTLMTDDQVGEVRELTRKARISATTTRLAPGSPLLEQLAPGERSFGEPEVLAALTGEPRAAKPERSAGPAAATAEAGERRPRPRGRGRGGAGGTKTNGSAAKTNGTAARTNGTAARTNGAAAKTNGTAKASGGAGGGSGASTRAKRSGGSGASGSGGAGGPGGAAKASQNFRSRGR